MSARPVTLSSSYAGGAVSASLLAIVFSAVLALGLVGTTVYTARSLSTVRAELRVAKDTIESQTAQLSELAARTARIQKAVGQVQALSNETRKELRDAYRQDPEWAAAPVPGAVTDGLCKRGNCKPSVGKVPAPAN